MLIAEEINSKIKEAMKAREAVRLSTLKMLSSELHNAKINKMDALTSEEELDVVKKEAKKRRDAIEAYEKAGRKESAQQEKEELDVLKEFLPEEMSDSELEEIVALAISESEASTMQDMGKVMAIAMDKVAGRADGSKISSIVRKKLNA